MLNMIERTHYGVLLEDLLVIKLGGGVGLDLDYCLSDIAVLAAKRPVIIVHGVSGMMDRLCVERGIEIRTLTSPSGHVSRYTDLVTRDVFVEACERVNENIVERLSTVGIRAQGLVGDHLSISGARKAALRVIMDGRRRVIRNDYSGSITHVDRSVLLNGLKQGCVCVVPPIAASNDGFLNIDGDRAAAAIATAIGARQLVILSNVRGLYRDFSDATTLVRCVDHSEMNSAMVMADGRMKRKVLAAQEAIRGGVGSVIIADGRVVSPVSAALNGAGTEFTR